MPHESAKLLLEQAISESERESAIQMAMQLGMPLHKIEQHLDWLDATRGRLAEPSENGPSSDAVQPSKPSVDQDD